MTNSRVLVVDDNVTNLKLVSELLAFEGYEVLSAMDAEAAQVIIAATAPDLILMDIALPGMDGLTLTSLLKSDPLTRGIRIVALTAFAMKGDKERALKAGCDGYITKPIDTRALPGLLAEIVPPRRECSESAMSILVVEDNPSQLKLAHHVLRDDGHHDVRKAGTAEEALLAIKANPPQIILLDLSLPGMNGLTLIRNLKADPATRGIHVVAVTAFPEEFQEKAALAAGCDAFLPKPLRTREISGHLERLATEGGAWKEAKA